MARFFRFRLRTLMIAVMVFGCFGGWLAGHEHLHRVELHVINEAVGKRTLPNTRQLWYEDAKYPLGVGIYDDSILG